MRTVAAFDFDGTLIRHDSLIPFLARVVGWRRLAPVIARRLPQLLAVTLGRADRDAAKERLLVDVLAGVPHTELVAAGNGYAAHIVERQLRPDMRRRVGWHRAQGHEVVIVSASLDVYLDGVARALDAAALLCTTLEVDAEGRCTGRMLGGNCRAEEKAKRLRAFLGDAPVTLWAYGDSSGDDAMLAMADHPVRMRRRLGTRVAPPTEPV